jgi:hypothetical protein
MALTTQLVSSPRQPVAAAAPARPYVPPPSLLAKFPRFLWWVAWPTFAGLMWLNLGIFLLFLRAFNLVPLIASFMLALWVVNLFFSHLRSTLVLWLMLMSLGALAGLAALSPLEFLVVYIVVGVGIVVGFFWWGYSRASLQNLRASRQVEQLPIAGEPFIVQLRLENQSITQRGLRVIDHGKFHYHRWGIPALLGFQTASTKYEVFLPRRGKYPWGPLEVSSAYPFGLFRKRIYLETHDTTTVLPRMGRLHEGKLRRLLLGPNRSVPPLRNQQSRRTLSPADFCGVREFRPGDSPRYIHWRTTARVGFPMVREFEEPPLEHLIVVLDPWLPDTIMQLLFQWQRLRVENQQIRRMVNEADTSQQTLRARQAQFARLAEKETPVRQPLDCLEQAISLTATLCWNWGQQAGTKLYLAVAEAPFAVLDRKEAGSRGAVPLLERLAMVIGSPEPDCDGLCKTLEAADLPNCPVVVISTRATSPLVGMLGRSLRRPVNLLDVSQPTVRDLFITDASAEALL